VEGGGRERFWILDFGFWILDFGFWILDEKKFEPQRRRGRKKRDFGFLIFNFGWKSLRAFAGSILQHSKFSIQNLKLTPPRPLSRRMALRPPTSDL
jgi:hypothetical protein